MSPLQVNGARVDLTLAELQEMASRQQQQIEAQQQMLATKVVSVPRGQHLCEAVCHHLCLSQPLMEEGCHWPSPPLCLALASPCLGIVQDACVIPLTQGLCPPLEGCSACLVVLPRLASDSWFSDPPASAPE